MSNPLPLCLEAFFIYLTATFLKKKDPSELLIDMLNHNNKKSMKIYTNISTKTTRLDVLHWHRYHRYYLLPSPLLSYCTISSSPFIVLLHYLQLPRALRCILVGELRKDFLESINVQHAQLKQKGISH
jgi:hypothetical protein